MFQILAIETFKAPDSLGRFHYSIQVSATGQRVQCSGSTAPGYEAVQVDWSDDFHSLLLAHGSDFKTMSGLMFRMHLGQSVTFPVDIGRAVRNSVILG